MNLIPKAESLLAKADSKDAPYVSNCIDEIIKVLAMNGQQQHTEMFCSFYLKFLDRMFGEDVTKSRGDVQKDSTVWQKGVSGGWFKLLISNGVFSEVYQNTSQYLGQSYDTVGAATGRLIRHLAPNSSMFEILSRSEVGCEMKLSLLPYEAQLFISDHPVYRCIYSANHAPLCQLLLRLPGLSPSQKQMAANRGLVLLSPLEYFTVCMMRYPGAEKDLFSGSSATSGSATFGVHQGAQQQEEWTPVLSLHRRGVNKGWVAGVPFLVLLQHHLADVFPVSGSGAASVDREQSVTPSAASRSSPSVTGAHADSALRSDQEAARQRYAELFLRLAVEFWVDLGTVVRVDHHLTAQCRKHLSGAAPSSAPIATHMGDLAAQHPHPTEIVLLDAAVFPWTISSMQCTYMLLVQLLSCPAADPLSAHFARLSAAFDLEFSVGGCSEDAHLPADIVEEIEAAAASQKMQRLRVAQQGVFDMLRAVFAKGHLTTTENQVVLLAVEVWLLWIQPWTASDIADGRRGIISPHGDRSATASYSDQWKPYVAANLHFYSTLFACYLQMVARVPLSLLDAEGQRNFFMLERVLRAMAPLLRVVDELSWTFRAWYPAAIVAADQSLLAATTTQFGPATPRSTTGNSPRGARSPRSPRGSRGKLGTPKNNSSGSGGGGSRGVSGECHLMSLQHRCLFPDRRVDDLPDCGITDFRQFSGEAAVDLVATCRNMKFALRQKQGLAAKCSSLVVHRLEQLLGLSLGERGQSESCRRLDSAAGAIAAFFPETSFAAAKADAGSSSRWAEREGGAATGGRERNPLTGKLTALGKREMMSGTVRCSAQELGRSLHYWDSLETPVCSFEWPAVVRALVRLSHRLNRRYDLPRDKQWVTCPWEVLVRRGWTEPGGSAERLFAILRDSFRFNLRFLGRTRVVAGMTVLLLLTGMQICQNGIVRAVLFPVLLFFLFTVYDGSLPFFLK